MFPKISSTNRRSAWAIFEIDLYSSERSSGVFMRGIRTPRQNLSEKRWNALSSTRWGTSSGLRRSPSSSEKPIHLARGCFPELEDGCEAAELARNPAQLGRPFGRLG